MREIEGEITAGRKGALLPQRVTGYIVKRPEEAVCVKARRRGDHCGGGSKYAHQSLSQWKIGREG